MAGEIQDNPLQAVPRPQRSDAAALVAAYQSSLDAETLAWTELGELRAGALAALVRGGMSASGARRLLGRLEGRSRIAFTDPEQRQALDVVSRLAGPDLTGRYLNAATAWSDAADRNFRRASELADLGGIGLRAQAEGGGELGALKQDLLAIAARINPALDVRFVRELYGEGPALIASGASSEDRMPVAGMFEPLYMMATISLDPRYDRRDSMFHEAFHSIEGILTGPESSALKRAFPPRDGMTTSERAAIAFADWANRRKRLEDQGLGEDLADVRRGFRKLALFSGRAGQAFKQHGIADMAALERQLPATAVALFERVYGGEIGRRLSHLAYARPAAAGGVGPAKKGPKADQAFATGVFRSPTVPEFDFRNAVPAVAELIERGAFSDFVSSKIDGQGYHEDYSLFIKARDQVLADNDFTRMYPPTIEQVDEFIDDRELAKTFGEAALLEAKMMVARHEGVSLQHIEKNLQDYQEKIEVEQNDIIREKAYELMAEENIFDEEAGEDHLTELAYEQMSELIYEEIEGELQNAYLVPSMGNEAYFLICYPDNMVEAWTSGHWSAEFIGSWHESELANAIDATRVHAISGRGRSYGTDQPENAEGGPDWAPRTVSVQFPWRHYNERKPGFAKGSFGLVRPSRHETFHHRHRGWFVVHLASGLIMGPALLRLDQAKQLAEGLQAVRPDWSELTLKALADQGGFGASVPAARGRILREMKEMAAQAKRPESGNQAFEVAKFSIGEETAADNPPRRNLGYDHEQRQRNEFRKVLQSLDGSRTDSQHFSAFLDLSRRALTAPFLQGDRDAWSANETGYRETLKHYGREWDDADMRKAQSRFSEMFGMTVDALEHGHPILGQVAAELGHLNPRQGQYFTPMSVSEMMARMTLSDADRIRELIAEKGYISLHDPACGDGRMMMAAADVLKSYGIDPQYMQADLIDINGDTAKMAFIQTGLYGIPGRVTHGNGLSGESFESWLTPLAHLQIQNTERHRKLLDVLSGKTQGQQGHPVEVQQVTSPVGGTQPAPQDVPAADPLLPEKHRYDIRLDQPSLLGDGRSAEPDDRKAFSLGLPLAPLDGEVMRRQMQRDSVRQYSLGRTDSGEPGPSGSANDNALSLQYAGLGGDEIRRNHLVDIIDQGYRDIIAQTIASQALGDIADLSGLNPGAPYSRQAPFLRQAPFSQQANGKLQEAALDKAHEIARNNRTGLLSTEETARYAGLLEAMQRQDHALRSWAALYPGEALSRTMSFSLGRRSGQPDHRPVTIARTLPDVSDGTYRAEIQIGRGKTAETQWRQGFMTEEEIADLLRAEFGDRLKERYSIGTGQPEKMAGVPEFDIDSFTQLEPTDEHIDRLRENLYAHYEQEVLAEYVSKKGHNCLVTASDLEEAAEKYVEEIKANLLRAAQSYAGATVDVEAVEDDAWARARLRAERDLPGAVGEVDEEKVWQSYGDAIRSEADERASDEAYLQASHEDYAEREWRDTEGLGYSITSNRGVLTLTHNDRPVAEARRFETLIGAAQAHARGEDYAVVSDPKRALNPVTDASRWHVIDPIRIVAGHGFLLVPQAIGRGPFAVHRPLAGGRGYLVTHLPTGLRAGYPLQRQQDAVAWADSIMAIATPETMQDWNSLVRADVADWKRAPEFLQIEARAMADRGSIVEQARSEARRSAALSRKARIERLTASDRSPLEAAKFKTGQQKNGQIVRGASTADDGFRRLEAATDGFRRLEAALYRRLYEGKGFASRNDLRKYAASVLGRKVQPGSIDAKRIEETLERMAVLRAARIEANGQDRNAAEVFADLTSLSALLPALATRSSTSVRNQAYSTPTPIAWVVKRLAQIGPDHRVLDASAGNGALLTGVPRTQIEAIEIDPERAGWLERRGYSVILDDALEVSGPEIDRLVINPPFGKLPGGQVKWIGRDGLLDTAGPAASRTRQADQAHAWKALERLHPDGRAVLLLAAPMRSDGYRARESRGFYKQLYDHFNVTDHITLDGRLYRNQGASWPVEIILIEGRGPSSLPYPVARPPARLPDVNAVFDHFRTRIDGETGAAFALGRMRGIDRQSTTERSMEPAGKGLDLSTAVDRALKAELDAKNASSAVTVQLDYTPLSKATAIGTKVPSNLLASQLAALAGLRARIAQSHGGSIDRFVTEKLGFDKVSDLHAALKAEQIDAVALGIDQIDRRGSFINGDQTGGGKGRVQAALIRYAVRQGMMPIFVTERPDLYSAFARDLAALGMDKLRVFVTNSDLRGSKAIGLANGNTIQSLPPAEHEAKLKEIAETGKLGDFDIVFTNYSQLQTVAGEETMRRAAVRRLMKASRALFMRDEIHNAAGDDERQSKPGEPKNRAELLRELQWDAAAVIDSSATYAKRPGGLDLYGRTDLQHAVPEIGKIGAYVEAGGNGLAQMVASQLAEAGQYVRRERDMSGIEYRFESVEVDKQVAEGLSRAVAAIQRFDAHKQSLLRGNLQHKLLSEAKSVLSDPSTGTPGLHSTHFTALVHNIVSQGLLSITADHEAERMIGILKSGDAKPILGLQNTMGAFLDSFAQDNGILPGEELGADFGDVLKRYLERSRDVMIGDAFGDKERRRLDDQEIGAKGIQLYNEAIKAIEAVDWSKMPVSPIDHVRHRLEEAGYRMEEITGRKLAIEYRDGKQYLKTRGDSETSKAEAVRIRDRFNNGETDALLLNESAASGIDLHAAKEFSDRRQRVWIVGQAHHNINTHIQMLGRPDRLNQVSKPLYIHPLADIPAVIRPAAVLAKNLKRLNASVSGTRFGAFSAGAEDLFNKLGDRAAVTLMEMDPLTHARLGNPLSSGEGMQVEGAARKITGRFILLPLGQQAAMWDALNREYQAEKSRAEALGEDLDEAPVLDLMAAPKERMQLTTGRVDDPSPLKRPAFAYLVDANVLRRPYRWKGVEQRLAELNRLNPRNTMQDSIAQARPAAQQLYARTEGDFQKWLSNRIDRMAAQGRGTSQSHAKFAARHREQLQRISRLIEQFPVGRTVSITIPDQDGTSRQVPGVVAKIANLQRPGLNPAQAAAWRVHLIVADGTREIELPLSKLAMGSEEKVQGAVASIMRAESVQRPDGSRCSIRDAFDEGAAVSREKRVIVAGNVLSGFHATGGKGRPVYFTDEQGRQRAGVLIPKATDLSELAPAAVMTDTEAAQVFLDGAEKAKRGVRQEQRRLVASNGAASIFRRGKSLNDVPVYRIEIAGAQALGGKYYTDQSLTRIAGEFVSSGDSMVAEIGPDKLPAALERLQALGLTMIARGDSQAAWAAMGKEAPAAEKVSGFDSQSSDGQSKERSQRRMPAPRRSVTAGRRRPSQPVAPAAASQAAASQATGDYTRYRASQNGNRQTFVSPGARRAANRGGFGVEGYSPAYSIGQDPAAAGNTVPTQQQMRMAARAAEALVKRVHADGLDADLMPFHFGGLGILAGTAELYSGIERIAATALTANTERLRQAAHAAMTRFDQATGGMFPGGDGVERSLTSCLDALDASERRELQPIIAPIMLASSLSLDMYRTLGGIAGGEYQTGNEIREAALEIQRLAGDAGRTASEIEKEKWERARLGLELERLIAGRDEDTVYATGQASGGVGTWRGDAEPHADYDHFLMHRDIAAVQLNAVQDGGERWQSVDFVLRTEDGPRLVPALGHPSLAGLVVLPAPAFGFSEDSFDRNEIRWRVGQATTGILIGAMTRAADGSVVSPMLYTPQGASLAARGIHGVADWASLDPKALNKSELNRIGQSVAKAFASARDQDRAAWIERSLMSFDKSTLSNAGFRTDTTWWMPVDDATKPDLPSVPGPVQLYDDRESALDFDGRESVPVYVRMGNVADLSDGQNMHPNALAALREFYEGNVEALRIGVWQNTYDDYSHVEDDEVSSEKADEAAKAFDFGRFIEGLQNGDWAMAGQYDGDLKDVIVSEMGYAGFDTVAFPSQWDSNAHDVVILRPSSLRFAWDELEPAMTAAAAAAEDARIREEAWRNKYSEADRARMASDRDEEIAEFDLGRLSESGFDVSSREILWLASEKAEFPSIPKEGGVELLSRRTDTERLRMEATPVYVRRGRIADLTEIGREAMEIISDSDLVDTPAEALALKSAIESGRLDLEPRLRDQVAEVFEAEGYHGIRYQGGGLKRTYLFDSSDVAVAWDVLARGNLERRMADLQAGPALAAARRAEALAAPVLRIGGPAGTTEVETKRTRSAIDVAETVRRLQPVGTIFVFQDSDGAGRLFDGDARRAVKLGTGLNLVEIGEGDDVAAMIRIPSSDLERQLAACAAKHDNPVVLVSIDEKGRIALDIHDRAGSRQDLIDGQREAELSNPAAMEAASKQAREAAWNVKSLTERYKDVASAARRHEVPALKDGGRLVIAGERAALAAASHPLLAERLVGEGPERITWLNDDAAEQLQIGQALADRGMTLAIAEGYDRRSWKVFTLERQATVVSETKLAESPRLTGGVYDVVKLDHGNEVVLVAFEGDDEWRSFGQDAQVIAGITGQSVAQELQPDNSMRDYVALPRSGAQGAFDALQAEGRSILLAEISGDGNGVSVRKTEMKPRAAGFAADATATAPSVSAQVRDNAANSSMTDAAPTAGALAEAAAADQRDEAPEGYALWQRMKATRPNRLVFVAGKGSWRSFGADASTSAELSSRLVAAYETFPFEGRQNGRVTVPDWQIADVVADLNRLGRHATLISVDADGIPRARDYSAEATADRPALSAAPVGAAKVQNEVGLSLADRMMREAREKASTLPAPTTPAALRIHLDEALAHIAGLGEGPRWDQITSVLTGRGLLNASLHREISKASREIYPLNSGYAIWRHPSTRHWHVDSFSSLLEKMGPDGPLYGSIPKEAADILKDFSGDYLRQLNNAFANDLAAVKSEIELIAHEINPNAELAFVDRLFADGRTVVEGGAASEDRQPVLGLYFRLYQLIAASTDITRGDPRETVLHELYHDVEDLLTDREKAILGNRFPPRGGQTTSERAAEAFAKWAMGKYNFMPVRNPSPSDLRQAIRKGVGVQTGNTKAGRQGKTVGRVAANSGANAAADVHAVAARIDQQQASVGPSRDLADIDRGFAPIARFLERSSNMLKGRGFATWDDVFEQVRRGNVASRANIFDVTAEIQPGEAARLARLADLPKLAVALEFYGTRVDRRALTGQGVYALLRSQLSDQEIIKLLHEAGYSNIRDPGYATNLLTTKSALSLIELERHQRVTPIEIAARSAVAAPTSMSPPLSQTPAGGLSSPYGRTAPTRPAWGSAAPRSYALGRESADLGNSEIMRRETFALEGLDMLPFATDNAWTNSPNMPRKPANIPKLPEGLVSLFIPHEDYVRMREMNQIPEDSVSPGQFIYDGVAGHFLISKTHPDFDRLKQYATPEAQQTYREALYKVQSTHEAMLGFSSTTRPADRVYLYVTSADMDEIRKVKDVDFDRSQGLFWIPRDHARADEFRSRFASDEAAQAWTNERVQLARDTQKRFDAAGVIAPAAIMATIYGTAGAIGHAASNPETRGAIEQAAAVAGRQVDQGIKAAGAAMDQAAGMGDEMLRNVQALAKGALTEDPKTLAGHTLSDAGDVGADLAATYKAEVAGLGPKVEEAAQALGEGVDRTIKGVKIVASEHKDHVLDAGSAFASSVKAAASDVADTVAGNAQVAFTKASDALSPQASAIANTVSAKAGEVSAYAADAARQAVDLAPQALATAKVTGSSLAAKVMASGSEVVQAMAAKVGGITAAAGATADVAISAGMMGAAIGTAIYAVKRSQRLKKYEEVARAAPWMLTEKEFGQVAGRLYRLERSSVGGKHSASLVDKASGKVVYAVNDQAKAPKARDLVTGLHLHTLEAATASKVFLPDRVLLSQALETTRPGLGAQDRLDRHALLERVSAGGRQSESVGSYKLSDRFIGREETIGRAKAWRENQGLVSVSPSELPALRNSISTQLSRMPPELVDAALARTAATGRRRQSIADRSLFANGRMLIETEQRKRLGAELQTLQQPTRQKSSTRRGGLDRD